jgi:hypothetical protein
MQGAVISCKRSHFNHRKWRFVKSCILINRKYSDYLRDFIHSHTKFEVAFCVWFWDVNFLKQTYRVQNILHSFLISTTLVQPRCTLSVVCLFLGHFMHWALFITLNMINIIVLIVRWLILFRSTFACNILKHVNNTKNIQFYFNENTFHYKDQMVNAV